MRAPRKLPVASVALATLASLTASCASTPEFLAEDFAAHQPRTVYVMNPRNETLQACEPDVVAAFERGLAERGYTVGGADSDASLRPIIVAWSSEYEAAPWGYWNYVEIHADLIDHRSGNVLWRDRRSNGDEREQETSVFGGLIPAMVDAVLPPDIEPSWEDAEDLIDAMIETLPPRG